ncbi:MAG: cytochrome c [Gammaproteobacteria bacterium]|nr:cytochrome c [Gammaproteobacteria bacterium]
MPEALRPLPTLIASVLASACGFQLAAADGLPAGQSPAQVESGRYLTTVADCAACHTSRGGAPFAGGRPIETPFGKVVAANITPDPDTGIGNWTDAEFDTAVRLGRSPHGKWLYPAMPFPYYTQMSRAEVLAIRAYLRTVSPVRHAVRSNQLPFPLDIRASMRLWDALYLNVGPFMSDPGRPAQWNRGAYLVRGPAHCGACHTPKNFLGGDIGRKRLWGNSVQGWFAPDITQSLTLGIGSWSVADVAAYLKNGHNRFAAASGPMGEEVSQSSSRMNDADLEAIAAYLKNQPGPVSPAQPLGEHESVMVSGAAVYRQLCSACHQHEGTGVAYLIPDLAHSASVAASDPVTLLHVVIHGAQSVATDGEPTAPSMPAFGAELDDAQIAAVTTYVRNSWGHAAPATTLEAVHKARTAEASTGG